MHKNPAGRMVRKKHAEGVEYTSEANIAGAESGFFPSGLVLKKTCTRFCLRGTSANKVFISFFIIYNIPLLPVR